MQRKFTLQTKHRTVTITFTEMEDRIVVKFEHSKYGTFGDEKELRAWQFKLFDHYVKDRRPFQLTNPHTGEVMMVWGDEKKFFATIEKRNDVH